MGYVPVVQLGRLAATEQASTWQTEGFFPQQGVATKLRPHTVSWAGLIFWLTRNKFVGSRARFMAASRS